jgi:PD-(D/E)XK nuclease superfamily
MRYTDVEPPTTAPLLGEPPLPIPDLPEPEPSLPKLSRYRVEALLACSAWAPSPGGPEARWGSAFHLAAQLWHRNRMAEGPPLALEEYVEHAVSRTPGFPMERRDELGSLLFRWLASPPDLGGYDESQAEVLLERTAEGVAVLSGIADRIDADAHRVRIVDYKTAWLSTATPPRKAPFQLMFYAWLAARRWLDADTFELVQSGVRTDVTWAWTMTLAEVEAWGEAMTARLAAVLAAEPTPTGGTACQYCAKRWACGAAIASAAGMPENDSQAEEVVQDVVRLEAALDERKAALKAFMADREPAVFAGMKVGYTLTAPSVRLVDKERAVAEGIAKVTPPALRFGITKAKG